jgi:hypothetical protein
MLKGGFAPILLIKSSLDRRRRVNAGEILQRLAGVKVQHGRKQEGPQSGAFLFVASHS